MTNTLVAPCCEKIVLDVADLLDIFPPTTAYEILYYILKFRKYFYMDESEVCVSLTPFDDGSGFFELLRKSDDMILEWAYIDIHEC